ncbi:MAG: hypothetical protein OEY64_10535 [Nitrospinota bacterium]|nr:hypothetical protein [Nitrospinota bacterium]
MPHYRLDTDIMGNNWRTSLIEGGAIKLIEDPETGLILVWTEKPLQSQNGMEKCTAKIFDKTARKIEKNVLASAGQIPLPGLDNLEDSNKWKLETYSTRKAELGNFTLIAGVSVLRVLFGGGRGDSIFIGRDIGITEQAGMARFKAYLSTLDSDPVSIRIVLTTENERPWLETEPQEIQKGVWQDISFNVSEFGKDKYAKITRLNLSIVTNVDSGYLLIDNLFISC